MADKTPEVQALIRTVNIHTIQKQQLSSICQRVSIPKTGNKADLIRRIVEQINISANSQDWARFEEIRRTIAAITGLNSTPVVSQTTSASTSTSATASSLPQPYPQPRSQGTYYQPIPPNPNSPQYHAMASYGGPGYGPSQGSGIPGHPSGINGASRPAPAQNFNFKPSPFYEMKRQIGRTSTLEVMTQHRNTSRFQLSISEDPILSRCATDDSIKVMVFSAGSNDPNQDIAFPHQCEIKVNGDDIKANLRGLKNKPGSTRPVDITHALRFRPATYMNSIEVTYALTQKVAPSLNLKTGQFFVSIIVCKMIPVETLVGQITKKIPKVSVIAEITRQNNDDEIEATSQNLSLKCPLSYMRLQRPCRALACNHIQCFDATSYLQLQEQGPQWMCPICNKPAPFDQLAIDEYALDILSRTNESVEQVTIDPNGQWKVPGAKDDVAVAPVKSEAASFVLDDDLVISEVPLRGDRSTITPSMTSVSATYIGTPNSGLSRDTSAAPRSSSKRPAPEVIDLTLSDDEEEARPPKRVNYGNTNSSRNYHSYNGNGNSY